MKTLDEVIKAIEWCTELDQSGCGACPYSDNADNRCYEEDALHYLKVYRKEKTILKDSKEHWEYWASRYYNEIEKAEANDPLDWETLKTMEGKPVWVEGSHGCIWGQKSWALIRFTHDGDMLCLIVEPIVGEFYIGEEDYGTDWQAYRKERS